MLFLLLQSATIRAWFLYMFNIFGTYILNGGEKSCRDFSPPFFDANQNKVDHLQSEDEYLLLGKKNRRA